jgi:ABC-type antimicrobial peptide transport system permease subunit
MARRDAGITPDDARPEVPPMFQLSYMLAELRRRRARTILTALGLAVGIALVITTNAVSRGLDDAQQTVLEPLTGVGTDMTVTRPLTISDDGEGGFQDLSPAERERLREQAGPGPGLSLRDAEPGSEIDTDTFSGTSQLTFSAARVRQIAGLDGVEAASGSLTLRANHISGTVPDIDITQAPAPGGPSRGGGAPTGAFGDGSIEFDSRTVTGVDQTRPDIAPVTPSQVVKGAYFTATGAPREAIVSSAYAGTKDLAVGDTIDLGGTAFRIVGVASPPIGGTASDVYVKLATLQKIADDGEQVSAVQVRAASAGDVDAVAAAITAAFPDAQVTTASDLAARVGGSLQDTRDLSSTLGTVLAIVGLVAAILIASLLTLSSVAKRTRELGTLKALGWSRWAVVRQICGESLIQGVLGGVVGVAVGLLAILAINASGWTLTASVAAQGAPAARAGAAPGGGPPGAPPGGGGFGLGDAAVTAGEEIVEITTSPSFLIVVAAVALAALGGLIAGAAGSLRAARLRPAAALRTVE